VPDLDASDLAVQALVEDEAEQPAIAHRVEAGAAEIEGHFRAREQHRPARYRFFPSGHNRSGEWLKMAANSLAWLGAGDDHAVMSSVRPAVVAGRFYPADADVLAADVDRYLAEAKPDGEAEPARAYVVPHAGYIYSGAVAGTAYKQIGRLRGAIERVVLLGPSHRVAFQGVAVSGADEWQTPLGAVPIDTRTERELAGPVGVLPQAHAFEHCLEVQLPFLQRTLGSFSLVALVVGEVEPQALVPIIDGLWDDRTLVLVSSDLSHYHPYREAQRIDGQTAEMIVHKDARVDHEQACGATPLNALLLACARRGLSIEQLDLRNSGDTAGDKQRVVGYGAFACE
jgi:AmmeMemoRadiSam system protein B